MTLRANQIVSGLALTIFAGGLGLSAYLGNDLGLADVPPKHQFGQIDLFGADGRARDRARALPPVRARLRVDRR